jgi:hypothetical protein
MKTGIIFYITGEKDPEQEINQNSVKNALPSADLYRFADNEEEIVNYWWELTAKGMHRILCQIAQLERDNNIRITQKSLRLSG